MPLWSKKHISIIFVWAHDMSAFSEFGDADVLHFVCFGILFLDHTEAFWFIIHGNSLQKVVFFGSLIGATKTHKTASVYGHQTKFIAPSLLIFSFFPNFRSKISPLFLCLHRVFLPPFAHLIFCQQWVTGCWPFSSFIMFRVFIVFIFEPFMSLIDSKLPHSVRTISLC